LKFEKSLKREKSPWNPHDAVKLKSLRESKKKKTTLYGRNASGYGHNHVKGMDTIARGMDTMKFLARKKSAGGSELTFLRRKYDDRREKGRENPTISWWFQTERTAEGGQVDIRMSSSSRRGYP
jgi:hypothetical protein